MASSVSPADWRLSSVDRDTGAFGDGTDDGRVGVGHRNGAVRENVVDDAGGGERGGHRRRPVDADEHGPAGELGRPRSR